METIDQAFQFDRQKFVAAVHYMCARQPPAEFSRFKLHRALFLAEMLHFLETGQPLAGGAYVKQQFGPAARELSWATRELEREGRLRVVERMFVGIPRIEFVATTAPDEQSLNDKEKRLLNAVSDFVCGRGARELADLDCEATWAPVEYGDVIPYFMAYSLVPCEVTDEDVEWAKGEARQLGLIES